jgi:multiple sugar transport system substrate-binding protein
VLEGPLEQAIFDGQLFSAPWYGNTQLLWYYKSIAEQTGVDPSQGPVTWEQLIDAASRAGKSVAAQGRRNESLMVWVNALVQSAGGTILDPNSQGQPAERVEPTIDSPAGEAAAEIMRSLADSPAAPPAFSTAGEEESRALFQSEDGAYMVNWTYVWAAFDAAIEEGALPADYKDDIGWARYPRVYADTESAPPSGGIGLSIGAFSRHPELTVELIRCLTSVESEKEYMLTAGDPAAKSAVYDDPAVRQAFPMADDIRVSIDDAGPRPISPYYGDVTSAVQRGFHPPDAIVPETTPQQTAALLKGVLTNQQLL